MKNKVNIHFQWSKLVNKGKFDDGREM